MFKHILLPTDGSEASEDAIKKCIQFAKDIGAKVTGFHVTPQYHLFTYQAEMLEDTKEQFMQAAKVHAATYLAVIEDAARQAGVPCAVAYVSSDHPYEAIIDGAKEHHCDLIAMASHGRKGVKGILMGSETHKVLTHSQIPVLVYR
ncbi:universal stress protein [Herbaspirillum sp. ST 5-3]|uniref:universal stress protein n=1 Tax=Oxalobacteraceae TaxID=75682 RepID=UPI0010A55FD4|nr:universal stress protein [Herbaspirillum sp. ST 5-3]